MNYIKINVGKAKLPSELYDYLESLGKGKYAVRLIEGNTTLFLDRELARAVKLVDLQKIEREVNPKRKTPKCFIQQREIHIN